MRAVVHVGDRNLGVEGESYNEFIERWRSALQTQDPVIEFQVRSWSGHIAPVTVPLDKIIRVEAE